MHGESRIENTSAPRLPATAAMEASAFEEQLARLGAFPMGAAQSFKAMMEKETASWGPAIKRAGITLEWLGRRQ